jgi:hypothetical protein
MPLDEQNNPESPSFTKAPASLAPDTPASKATSPQAPAFVILQRRPLMLTDLFRALLIVLTLTVIAGLVLILLPQSSVDKMVQFLQSRYEAGQPEKFALLYLGDEIKNNEFQVRGVIRNISTIPLEQLDASIRFISHDGNILETTVVRMNKETIGPGEIAQFELVYPNYAMEFRSYAVEFKLRYGKVLPYKDMRSTEVRAD